MLRELCKNTNIKMCEIADMMEMKQPLLNRLIDCSFYSSKDAYNKLYDILERYNSVAPRKNDVTMYPSDQSKGAWSVYYKDQFLATLVFVNMHDVIRFLNGVDGGDMRLQMMMNYLIPKDDVKFDNNVSKKAAK